MDNQNNSEKSISLLDQLMNDNPLIKSGIKKLQKNQDVQIDEAQSVGVPTQEILKQLITTHAPQSAFTTAGATQDEKGNINIQQGGWVNRLLQGLAGQNNINQDLERLKGASQIQQNQQQGMNQGVYEFDPYGGGVKKITDVPAGSIVRNRYVDPSELIEQRTEASKDLFKYKETGKRETEGRVQMAVNLDQMDVLLNDMEQYLQKDPDVFIKGLNPLGEREFKAILQNFDKTAAIAAGGKQLTKTELDLIRNTRPTILDTKNPRAIAYKFNILRNTIGLARERLNKGTKYESQSSSQGGQGQDVEYQKYLQAIGR